MVTLFTDRRMLDHTPPPRHPERPERLQAILRQLERTGLARALPGGPGPRGDARGAARGSTRRTISTRSPSSRPRAAG